MGKDDVNNLITLHSDVENNHFKLWMSSTTVLDRIVHRKIVNQSQFAFENIKNKIKLYVQNISFHKALEVFLENRYLILSGIPGIGKTTLAQMLSYYLLSKDVEEFIFLSESIDEGYEMFENDRKQVFLFDDFLGANFLENSISTN